MIKLYFDIRDIFRVPRLSLSGKKIWVNLIGLIAGYAVYLILSYVALLANGQPLSEIWQTHYFFPCLFAVNIAIQWYAWLIYAIGIAAWVLIFLLTSTAVSRITYKQLKGDEFFSSGDSFRFVKKHWTAPIMGPISVILIIAFFIVLAIIAAWIAKWPVLDILFLGLPYLLYFIVAVFVVYTAVVLIVSLLLSPSIVATAEEDTMETVFQSYSTLWAQPWRLVIYEALVGVLTAVATFIYGYAMIFGYRLINLVFGQKWLMDGKISKIMEAATSYIFGIHSPLTPFISRFFKVYTPSSLGITSTAPLSTTETITAVLVCIFLFVIAGTVVSYALTNFTVGQTLIYVILRKKKDDENLIERKDEDELEEEEEEEEEKEEIKEEKSEEKKEEEKKNTDEGKEEKRGK
ncbi:MAG: hypothetical protein DRP91_06335 [Candidatus Neomarinimicrobiota bacterium]|nr:MAG: hypothetical protein DRP91_06335 [Candidatus Neomarinimicrobiota bacterium]